MQGIHKTLCLIVIVLLVLVVCLQGCSSRYYEAALVLADIAAGDQPSRLKRIVDPPARYEVTYPFQEARGRGDLYRPARQAQAALLLVPGVAEAGKDDPRLVAFATTLARAGFAVLVPDLPNLRRLQVSAADAEELAAAFAWLVSDPELAPEGRAGMAAFSYATGPVLLAALDDQIRTKVQFILAVGGYYDLPRVLTFFTTGYFLHDGQWHYLRPNDYGKWVFVAGNVHRLKSPEDRRIFRDLAERKLADPSAPVEDLTESLGEEGRALMAFLDNDNPQRAEELLADLPEALIREVAALNLANKDLTNLYARLILIHGLGDPLIPYVESVDLAAAVAEDRVRLFLVRGLNHVDMEPGLPDRWRLWRAVTLLLQARDGRF